MREKELSDAKRKELETRLRLGPRLGQPKSAGHPVTAPPSLGRRRFLAAGRQHPTRDGE